MNVKAVFLHSGPGHSDYLAQFFADQFSPQLQAIFYTQRRTKNISLNSLLDQLEEQIGSEAMPVILIGHSWGGILAIEYLRQKRDQRIKGIVLISSFLHADDATVEYELELESRGIHKDNALKIFFSSDERKLATEFLNQIQTTFDQEAFNFIWSDAVANFDARTLVKSLKIPILNIFGDRDIRVPAHRIRTYNRLNEKIVNCEIVGAGHFPFLLPYRRDKIVHEINMFWDKITELQSI